jgi:hypothetical protein
MVAARPKTALPYRRLSTAYRGRVPRARVTHRSAGTIERTLSTSKGARVTVFGKCRGDKSKTIREGRALWHDAGQPKSGHTVIIIEFVWATLWFFGRYVARRSIQEREPR